MSLPNILCEDNTMYSKLFFALLPAALLGSAALAHSQPPPPAAAVFPPPAAVAPALPTMTGPPSAAGPVGPAFIVEYNTDLPGSDLRPGFPVGDFGQCMNACVEDPGCRAFTWVKPHEQPPRRDNASPLCWLKGSAPNKIMNPGMISGIRR
ncbi:PAN domain-containing protein [Candidatus Electronema sp. JC]|uniref:PAN domain-containing protein n=1 Tax=Candidatus Electronema sp. JC TaxID=3401570 RepID=UPI003B42A356